MTIEVTSAVPSEESEAHVAPPSTLRKSPVAVPAQTTPAEGTARAWTCRPETFGPMLVHDAPPSRLLKVPLPLVPAYTVFGVAASTASESTVGTPRPLLAALHEAPPSTL